MREGTRPHLCHVFPAFATGGPEVRTALLIDASADEFRHTVVSLNGILSGRGRVLRGEAVRFLEAPRDGGQVGNALALGRLLKELKPDLVLTYGWGGTDAVAAARLAGFRRLVHTEDGFLPDEALGQKPKRVLVRRLFFRLPLRVVVPSRNLLRIATKIWWLPRRRVRYVPNGVDVGRFAPRPPEVVAAARKRLGCSPEEIVIGTVGHLREEKNQERLLRAFAAVAARRPARLLLIGDGPLREPLGKRAQELGVADRVVFPGVVSDTWEYYPAMDVFALSSDTEQMPIAVLEAMGTGRPVVSTDVGDVKDMVSAEGRRRVTPRGDDVAYTKALDELADDPGERALLGRANRAKCLAEYDVRTMVGAYLGLYREALGAGRR